MNILNALKIQWMTRPSFEDAWQRCLPVLAANNGGNDWHGMQSRPFYSPSFACRLARRFAKRYVADADRLLKLVDSGDARESISVLFVLENMGCFCGSTSMRLQGSASLLPVTVRGILEDVANAEPDIHDEQPYSFNTIGDYYSYVFEAQA